MEKRILGLDPGLASLGFGGVSIERSRDANPETSTVSSPRPELGAKAAEPQSRRVSVESNGLMSGSATLLDFGIIQTPPRADLGERLCIIHDDLHTLIEQFQPHLVAVEKLFFYRMGNTILVAQARGVLLLVLAQHKVPLVEFTPAQIKQALTGYGNADKQAVQQAVARELNLDHIPKPDDAADALAVALAAWFQT